MKTDIITIFLILLSGAFAFIFPFQTFLFVYAFLGPLHYLTEINWLQQRNYFLQDKTNVYYLFVPIILIGSIVYIPTLFPLKPIIAFLIFFTFLVSIFNGTEKIKLYKNWKFILCLFIGSITNIYFKDFFKTIFSIFLPSLIHVFIFTGIFILSGFLKTKNKLSLLTFIVFLATSIFLLNFKGNNSLLEENILSKYHSFEKLNQILLSIFGEENTTKQIVYFSVFGIKLMQFIAFAYTYHYLNWFSKTAIIQWHKTTKIKISVIIIVWILSVLLYLNNYKSGLYWLYLLSLTHIILEFPLDITSVKNFLIKK